MGLRAAVKRRVARAAMGDAWPYRHDWWVLPEFRRGFDLGDRGIATSSSDCGDARRRHEIEEAPNPLWDFFSARVEGPGIWKWEHYFEIYQRHFQRFVGTPVDLMEIGIYSGGSLDMWASYFGDDVHVWGVDIEPSCAAYERDGVTVLVGDQEDRSFWSRVKREVGGLDILIDDGGHTPEQQMVTFEEMWSLLRPGGVYLCEDIHGVGNGFASFAAGLVSQLHAAEFTNAGDVVGVRPTALQRTVHSMHFYPFVLVIEKHAASVTAFTSSKHGSEWNPAASAK